MAQESNSSVVSIVAILAIVILVGLGIYFLLIANGNGADIEIDLPGASSFPEAVQYAGQTPASQGGVPLTL